MSAYVYVLRSSLTGRHTIGSTTDLEKKIARHSSSHQLLTTSGSPWECVYVEICDGLEEARKRVRHLKDLQVAEGTKDEENIKVLYTARINTRPYNGNRNG